MANTFKRMEKKTTLPTCMVEDLKARIAPYMNDDPFNVDGKPYMICNLYYDDMDDHVIRGSVQLPKYKEKLRLRTAGRVIPISRPACMTANRTGASSPLTAF